VEKIPTVGSAHTGDCAMHLVLAEAHSRTEEVYNFPCLRRARDQAGECVFIRAIKADPISVSQSHRIRASCHVKSWVERR
jgi:hypothetical protein